MAGYDPKKAAEYNKLIQQGVDPEAAIAQAGITAEDSGNYEINSVGTAATNRDYGKMSGLSIGQGKVAGVDYDKAPADPAPTFAQTTKVSYTTTSTETVSGGGSTTITTGPRLPTAQSQEYAAAGSTKQVEIDEFIKNNPSNFARKRQGLPPLSPEENQARSSQLNSLQDQRSQLYNQQTDAETPSAPTITSTPNTTTTTQTVSTQISASKAPVNFDQDEQLNQSNESQLEKTTTLAKPTSARDSRVNPTSDPSQFPAYDDEGNLQPGFKINEENGRPFYQGQAPLTRDVGVSPQSDPSQFPAYDDNGYLQPGFKINEENGQTYYAGVGPFTSKAAVDTNNGGEGFGLGTPDGYGGFVDAQGDPVDSNGMPIAGVPPTTYSSPVNDPYYGLTSTQLQDLGGADPTDPYIRARLGIPQLPGSTLFATGGFGTIKTGVPAIDSALGIIGGGLTSLFSNFSSTIGGLFGAKPTASATAATTGSGVAGLTTPATTPPTKDTAVNPASDPSQFPAYDDEGNLQPGFAVNDETGQTYYKGVGPATSKSTVDPTTLEGFGVQAAVDPTTLEGFSVQATVDPTTLEGYGVPASSEGVTARGINTTTLNADQADAFYNGTGTLTADQRTAQDQQTAADAAALYPGTDNTNLKNIDAASGAIARNQVGITNAEQIITENNAELADPNISDERRAELEANNASQENYIRLANDNTAENELVIEANADGYAAGGGNPDSGQGPDQVAALTDPGLDPNFVSDAEQIAAQERTAVNEAQDQDPGLGYVSDAEQIAAQERAAVNEAQDLTTSEDPFEQSRLDAQEALDAQPPDEFEPQDVSAEQDPFEASRLEAEQELNRQQLTEEATDVEPGLFTGQTDEFGGVDEAVAQQQQDVDNQNDPGLSQEQTDAEFERLRTEDQETNDVDPGPGYVSDSEEIAAQERAAVNEAQDQDPGPGYVSDSEEIAAQGRGGLAEAQESQFQGSQERAIRDKAQQQATFQARYKQPGNADWRVRLSLAPDAQYLYNAGTPRGTGAGILAPLAKTDGVIFPYTPSITTTYSANYEQYDLVHSNYRGLFYKNSRVGDIQIRGTFTAQDTVEAGYLLAVIHFFRSATKMFYGQDAERGAPPPVCLLNGFGDYQFSNHPVVISSFNYTTPNDVDYIRATDPNNYGSNLLNRRAAVASNPGGQNLAGLFRMANSLLQKGAPGTNVPAPGMVQQSVSNTAGSTYVPTKMEIDITLIPVQTRTQVSKQFSLKGFANGQLLKGGFW